MERIGDILPLLIFILIPIIRGLNNSKKQKNVYQKSKKANNFPYQQAKPSSVKPWRSIIDEVGKDMKGLLESETKLAKKVKPRREQDFAYSKDKEETSSNVESVKNYEDLHFEGKPKEVIKGEIMDSPRKDKVIKKKDTKEDNSLNFSSNPIVQGLIFSEIIGPPKSKR